MKFIKTLYNLKNTTPFERDNDGKTLIVEPKNIGNISLFAIFYASIISF